MATAIRGRSVKIEDPKAYFADWAFAIEPHHYETLGLGYREFVKDKKPFWSWAVMDPIEYWLEVGYVFFEIQNPAHFLQVVADWDALHIEVHEGVIGVEKARSGFAVTSHGLATWLRTGIRPPNSKELDIASSKAGLLTWHLANKTEMSEGPAALAAGDVDRRHDVSLDN